MSLSDDMLSLQGIINSPAIQLPVSRQFGGSPIPSGKQILWIEAYQEAGNAFTDERFSFNQSDAAMMRYYTNWDAISDPSLSMIFRKAIVGGYYPPTGKKIFPLQHPYIPYAFAKDIVSIESLSINPTNFTTPIPCQLALVTVSYESLPYGVANAARNEPTTGTPYNPNWVTVKTKAANQRITTPFGLWVFSSGGTFAGLPAAVGNFTTNGILYVDMTIHGVPFTDVFPSGLIKPLYADLTGQINKYGFFGFAPKTLVLDSVDSEVYGDSITGANYYNVTLHLIYNSLTWPVAPAIDGNFYPINYIGAPSIAPWSSMDLLQVLNTLNPVSEI